MENALYVFEVPDMYCVDSKLTPSKIEIDYYCVQCTGENERNFIFENYHYQVIGFAEATILFPYAVIVFGKNDEAVKEGLATYYTDESAICFSARRTDVDGLNEYARSVYEKITSVMKEISETTEEDVILTTTDSIDGYEIVEYKQLVSGTDIYLVGGLIGGGLASQENLFGTALMKARKNLSAKAVALKGNAVIGIRQSFASPGAANFMILALTGTAVRIRKKSNAH